MKVMDKTSKVNIEFGNSTGVYAYGLYQNQAKRKPIYVHSKLIIIDDRYLAIGSANVDARRMHIETELTLGIVDGDTVDGTLHQNKTKLCRFAVELRQKLWKEHLGISKFTKANGRVNPIAELEDFPGVKTPWPANEKAAKIGSWCPSCGQTYLGNFKFCPNDDSPLDEPFSKHHVRCYVNRPGRELLTAPPARLLDREERRFRRYRLCRPGEFRAVKSQFPAGGNGVQRWHSAALGCGNRETDWRANAAREKNSINRCTAVFTFASHSATK